MTELIMRYKAYAWVLCFVLVMNFHVVSSKCTETNVPQPKTYLNYDNNILNLTIQTSSRAAHKMISHIFKIVLEEHLDFMNVKVVEIEDDFNATKVVDIINGKFSTNHSESVPSAMINLETWVPSHFNTISELESKFVADAGSLRPPGRFGWFVPKDLTAPIVAFDPKWPSELGDVPWTFFRDDRFASHFHIDNKTDLLGITNLTLDDCYNKEVCGYVPSRCVGKRCATLLAPMIPSTDFLKDQVEEYGVYVEVIWFQTVLFKKTTRKVHRSMKQSGTDRSMLIMAWTPSDIIYPENDFVSVIFNKCYYTDAPHLNCISYEPMRLEKFIWSELEKYALSVYQTTKNMYFNDATYGQVIEIYDRYNDKETIEDMACRWVRSNEELWQSWHIRQPKTQLHIGGIYPLQDPRYKGHSIYRSVMLALRHINENETILNDYELKPITYDGRCNAETVMRQFIQYVHDVKENVVGVVGPACSDTVEPLAGVSMTYRMVFISYSAEGASFSDRKKYPYFFRTIGSNSVFQFVYLKLFEQLGWKRVAALTEDGQKYTEYISYTQNLLESSGIKFITNAKFPRKETNMMKYLKDLKNQRARIIIADVVDRVARSVMCEAFHLEMTIANGYVWFLPSWLYSTWYDTDSFNKDQNENVRCSTSEMISAIDGYFSLTPAFWGSDDSPTPTNLTVQQWKETYFRNIWNGKPGVVSDYAGFAYDAVWTYALALDKLVRMDPDAILKIHDPKNTETLVKLIEGTNFDGVSGRINFRNGSTRYSTIQIDQWHRMNRTTVGYFYPNVTDGSVKIEGGRLDLNSSAIWWPSGIIPDDGTPEPNTCSLDLLARLFNVSCEMAIVILCIIIFSSCLLIIIVRIMLFKRKLENKVEETLKVMAALGLDPDKAIDELNRWEVSREHVVINRKLGEGAFGTVYGGELYIDKQGWVAVAVKTLKKGSTFEEKLDFLSEAETMKKFDHKNIIKLQGVCMKDEPVYTIMEFMLYGDLKTYLLARRNLVSENNVDEHDDISSKRLTSMALDVARGLSYLADKNFVHRDIACRNCLVSANKVVKIGDFGMSRPMCENNYYRFNRKGMLPVRWMAPESIVQGLFTSASDVWSYGVVLFEIITFGSFPFQGLSNPEVVEYAKEGKTLTIPKGVNPQLEIFMKSCWNQDPNSRPSASESVEFLANNPQLISPCLEAPSAAIAREGTDNFEFHIKSTPSRPLSPAAPPASVTFRNVTFAPRPAPAPVEAPPLIDLYERAQQDSAPDSGVSMQFDYCEPLLGSGERSASLTGVSFMAIHHNHSSPDLCARTDPRGGPGTVFKVRNRFDSIGVHD